MLRRCHRVQEFGEIGQGSREAIAESMVDPSTEARSEIRRDQLGLRMVRRTPHPGMGLLFDLEALVRVDPERSRSQGSKWR